MYTIEQLEALPGRLAEEAERVKRMRPDETALKELALSLKSRRQMLEGIKATGNADEVELAGRALDMLGKVELLAEERRQDAELVKAREEIDSMNMQVFKTYLACDEPELRIRVVFKAVEIDFEATIPLMKERLSHESDSHVVSALVKAVGLLGRSFEFDFLREWVQHKDARVRANAVEGMAFVDDASKTSLLTAMLGDSNHRVRLNAALALHSGRPELLTPLLNELMSSSSVTARRAALWAADGALARAGRSLLIRGLDDRDFSVRSMALDLLGTCDDEAVASRLAVLLKNDTIDEHWKSLLRQRLISLQASPQSAVSAIARQAVSLSFSTGAADASPKSDETEPQKRPAGTLPPGSRKLRPPPGPPKPVEKREFIIRLAGKVIDSKTRKGIKQVSIRIAQSGYQTTTDSRGRFSMERLTGNKVYVFVCERTGYPTVSYRFRASAQRDQSVIIRMRKGSY